MQRAKLGVGGLGGLLFIVGAAGVTAGSAGCGGGARSREANDARAGTARTSPVTCEARSKATPIGSSRSSSTIAVAKVEGRRVAFVADEDAKAILTIDLDSRSELALTPLGATPAQLLVANDGRVLVTLRDTSELAAFTARSATSPLARCGAVSTPSEPIAIAASPRDASFLVTSAWAQSLTAYDGASLIARFEVSLPREPRAVVASDDGSTAFVSHAVGSVLSVVDLAKEGHPTTQVSLYGRRPGEHADLEEQRAAFAKRGGPQPSSAEELTEALEHTGSKGRPTCQGFALVKAKGVEGRIFGPQVLVDPGDLEARPDGYGDENEATERPSIAVFDEDARKPLASSMTLGSELALAKQATGQERRDPRPDCLLPRAAVVDEKTKSLLVTCYGIDAVVAYDASSPNPISSERRRWTVGSGPSGIAVDVEKHRAVVWSQFDRTLSTFPIGGTELTDDRVTPRVVQKTAMAPLHDKVSSEYALGRILFHAAGDARISSDGRACASCHPDGRDDAITWATPEGPRRSIMLAGRVTRSAPYSWNGNEGTLHNHLGNTFDRLSGRGLRSIELDALVTYLERMPAPPSRPSHSAASVNAAASIASKAKRGETIFNSTEAGCAGCHSGPAYTDGQNHDVASKHAADREASFNTPSLRLVGGTGPFFHDGRYKTLAELLRKTDGSMGKTRHLSADDLDALETFLRTL